MPLTAPKIVRSARACLERCGSAAPQRRRTFDAPSCTRQPAMPARRKHRGFEARAREIHLSAVAARLTRYHHRRRSSPVTPSICRMAGTAQEDRQMMRWCWRRGAGHGGATHPGNSAGRIASGTWAAAARLLFAVGSRPRVHMLCSGGLPGGRIISSAPAPSTGAGRVSYPAQAPQIGDDESQQRGPGPL